MLGQKLSALLLLASAATAQVTFANIGPITSDGVVEVQWTFSPEADGPQIGSLELNNQEFNEQFALANAVPFALSSTTITVPAIPTNIQNTDNFALAFVVVTNISSTIAATSPVSVGGPTSTSSTSASTTSSSSSQTGLSSSSISGSSSSFSSLSVASSSSFSVASSTGSSSSSSSSAAAPTNLNGASASLNLNAVSYGVMALGAILGAAFVAL